MAIEKPAALRDWLARWNFDIFTWKVYIGDVVENAIDWALSWINYVLTWAETAYNWARAAWDKAVEVGRELQATINTEVQKLLNKISTWWGDLGEWWFTKVTLIKGWIGVAKDFLNARIDDLTRSLQRLDAAWEMFRSTTLPGLLSFTWFGSWWGKAATTFDAWWDSAWGNILETINIKLSSVISQVRQLENLVDPLRELVSDPEQWLLDRIESMLARFW